MKKIFKNMDIPLLLAVTLLTIIGLVFILSASSVKGVFDTANSSPYYYFNKQLFFIIISYFAGFIILCKSSKFIEKITDGLLIIGIILLLIVLVTGLTENGTTGWISFKYFTIQPSEFIKLIMILFLGKFFSNPKRSMNKKDIISFLLVVAIPIALIVAEPDFGTAAILSLIILITFLTIPLKNDVLQKVAAFSCGTVAVVFLVLLISGAPIFKGYLADRFDIKEPCSKYFEGGNGYQVCNGYIAINNGGLFGVGLGNSTQKNLYLPEAHTDFIFPIIVEELGVIPSILIILLYVFVLFRLFRISQIASTMRGSIIAFGVFVYIMLHFIINIGGVLSILPLTGVPLLFLSSGGSSLFTVICSIFIVERIAAESKIANKKQKIKSV